MESLEISAKTVEEAIQRALEQLGVGREEVEVSVVKEGKAGILGVGRIAERVVAEDGALTVRPTVSLTLAADHRLVDGAPAARFLQILKKKLEEMDFLG